MLKKLNAGNKGRNNNSDLFVTSHNYYHFVWFILIENFIIAYEL